MTHVLVIEPGHSRDDPQWEVRHPPDCPQEVEGGIIDSQFHYRCNVQFCLDHVGIDDIDPEGKLAPGEYPIGFHGYWSGSMFDDSEAYIYIAEGAER